MQLAALLRATAACGWGGERQAAKSEAPPGSTRRAQCSWIRSTDDDQLHQTMRVVCAGIGAVALLARRSRSQQNAIATRLLSSQFASGTPHVAGKSNKTDRCGRIVVLAGPTGVGKSDLAFRLCKELDGEIVSADSVQVYRGLDIGSNKPSVEEQSRFVHHLVDVYDPHEACTAGEFYDRAMDAIAEINARGKVAVVVGGTMMYIKWLVDGKPEAPKPSDATAAEVQALLQVDREAGRWDNALSHLAKIDPTRAAALIRNDWYRLTRALEIAKTSSTPLHLMSPKQCDDCEKQRQRDEFDASVRCFYLSCADRRALNHSIDKRCEMMLSGGLFEEVTELLLSGKMPDTESSAARAIGYRQTINYLCRSSFTPGDEEALREFLELFTGASRQYAKRQMTWFRSGDRNYFHWVEVDRSEPSPLQRPAQEVLAMLRAPCLEGLGRDREAKAKEPLSEQQAQLRQRNVEQGKKMKTYRSKFGLFEPEHAMELQRVLQQADSCVRSLRKSDRFPFMRHIASPSVTSQATLD